MFNRRESNDDEAGWLSLSDLMTVLMVLFLVISIFIAVSATTRLKDISGTIKSVITEELKLCEKIKEGLETKFNESDINVSCNPITVTFLNPDYKFAKNSAQLPIKFEKALKQFFPFYLQTLSEWEYSELIDEIRIEGHTDSDGGYLYNMKLSQDRSRNVLDYTVSLNEIKNSRDQYLWTRKHLTANGLSFSRLLNSEGGSIQDELTEIEDKERSRRVEIKLRTKAREILFYLNGVGNGR